jgi:acyl-CoA thioesterase
MFPLIEILFDTEESDFEDSTKEPAASALNTKIENDVDLTNPLSSESLPSTTTTDEASDFVDWMTKLTVLEGAEIPEANRRVT